MSSLYTLPGRLTSATLAVLLIAGCSIHPKPKPAVSPTPPATVPASASPDTSQHPIPAVTPGVVLTTSKTDVCTSGWSAAHRKDLTTAEKHQVMAAYGLPPTTKVAEWDHLISLELGGGNGTRNVWPELDAAQKTRKDNLENRLHADVCGGSLTVEKAQQEIRNFWDFW